MAKVMLVGGVPTSLINFRGPVISELLRRGHEVVAVANGADSAVRDALHLLGVRYRSIRLDRTGTNPVKDLILWWDIVRSFREEKPDIVLAYTAKPVIYSLLAASHVGLPYKFALITGLGYAFTRSANSPRRLLLGKVTKALYKRALANANGVIFQNPDDRADFERMQLIKPTCPVRVVNGSGVDIDAFSPAPLPTAPKFLMIGRLIKDKGIREYVEAAKNVRKKIPDAEFMLVGGFDTNPSAIKPTEVEAWEREGVLRYLGKLQDVRPVIAESSVYVLPSYREGTPRTVLEAMAMGRPIITTDAPGCRETVRNAENGFLVPVGDIDRLADAMVTLASSPELRARMGAVSRDIAVTKYDAKMVAAEMVDWMFKLGNLS